MNVFGSIHHIFHAETDGMDQDSFRKLLSTNGLAQSTSTPPPRSSLLYGGAKKVAPGAKALNEPAFKPRKVKKKSEGVYRDRAEERRQGKESDYAQIEAVLEDFEKRNAEHDDHAVVTRSISASGIHTSLFPHASSPFLFRPSFQVEEKRKYLGGDSEHTVLVKGLDYSLLEQNKARLVSENVKHDDEALEAVFISTAAPVAPKRSRADVLRELKEKRAAEAAEKQPVENTVTSAPPEERQLAATGKFKPIGFKPVDEKGKKKKRGERALEAGEKGKKKRRKVEAEDASGVAKPRTISMEATASAAMVSDAGEPMVEVPTSGNPLALPPAAAPESAPEDDDVDIFAGAGDYEGLALDSDGESAAEADNKPPRCEPSPPSPAPRRGWFNESREPTPPPGSASFASTSKLPAGPSSKAPIAVSRSPEPASHLEDNEEEGPMRLQPLSSSALPSIKDLLALDEAAEKEEKRRAKKEKKKKGKGGGEGGGNEADKVNRDFQR
ncbi:hypothetical protein K488DRAFT_69523 [Vararia minispora EC-137]|uniref:Uncharacterized protein n=1 Tax=Vararia minispora EC-137 TaxID=1314806 RepID=A0ACB8QPZ6_9AGAM|nr:hypothetical protein K488DRAFT_69523 [Vararia minispora EC-137]